jgi:hypothetical protein
MAYTKLIAYDAVQAGVLSEEEIESARRDLPEAVFRELYLAEPNDDGGNPFGSVATIESRISSVVDGSFIHHLTGLSTRAVVAWGWDLAKSVDWTVGIGLDEKGYVAAFHRFQKPWPETIAFIKETIGRTPASIDSTGVGDPIVDILQREFGTNISGVKYTAKSKQQLMEGLAVAIQNGDVHYPKGPITIELLSFEYTYTRTGVHYTAPEGFHDDCVCALAQAHLCKGDNRAMLIWQKLGARG